MRKKNAATRRDRRKVTNSQVNLFSSFLWWRPVEKQCTKVMSLWVRVRPTLYAFRIRLMSRLTHSNIQRESTLQPFCQSIDPLSDRLCVNIYYCVRVHIRATCKLEDHRRCRHRRSVHHGPSMTACICQRPRLSTKAAKSYIIQDYIFIHDMTKNVNA